MLGRIVIFSAIAGFFIWDYFQDKKPFKIYTAPLTILSFFASTDYYVSLDERIQLLVLVVFFLLLFYYGYLYNHDYKVEKFREKKRLREMRESERNEKTEELIQEIMNAKHESRGINTNRVQITLDIDDRDANTDKNSSISESNADEKSENAKS